MMTGKELKDIRKELGWTQAKFAKYLGCGTNYFAQLERDARPITQRTARAAHVLYLVFRLARTMGLIEMQRPF
jgi:transcriptional regulator with XRE-family HTH domain